MADHAATAAPARSGSLVRLWRGAIHWPLGADASAALALAIASLVFYYPLVFFGRVLVDYDAFVYFYPQRAYLAHALESGRIPLWDPDLFLGAPFLANPQTAVLYPPSWLFIFGPVQVGYTVQLVLHAFLAAFFTYLLARIAFGAAPLAAGIGGLTYAFCGFAVGQVGHLNQISAAAWLPAVLLAYSCFSQTGRVKYLAFGAAALAMQLLAGHPQETYMTLLVLGIFGLVTAPWTAVKSLVLCGIAGAGMCALGALVAAAQVLPTLELSPLSIRGEGVNWADAVAGSLPSYLGVRALLPPYWVNVPYTEYLGYVSVTAVVLGLLAVVTGHARGVTFGLAIAFLGVFLALGENNGAYAVLFNSVPQFDTFRVPARWLLLWEFGVAVLAALGADWIGRGSRIDMRSRWLWPRVALVAAILVVALAWQRDEGEAFAAKRTPAVFAAITVATLGLGALPHVGRPLVAVGLLAAISGVELWAAADASPARQGPPAAFTDGETVDWLRAHGVTDQERLLSLARPEYVPASEPSVRAELSSVPSPLVEQVLVAQKWHDTLTPNVPLQYGLNTADGYDGGVLPLLRWLNLSRLVVESPRPDGVLLTRLTTLPSDRILDLVGVRYLIANGGTPARAGLQSVDFGDLELFVRPQPVPLSLVVFGATPAPDEESALERMSASDFDANREVVLEGVSVAAAPGADSMPVMPDRVAAEEWHARITIGQPGYLLQREALYPGWRARVDGVDTPLLRADSLFRAVPLAPGTHEVEVFFDSSSFKRGVLLSLGGLVVIIMLLLWEPILRTHVQGPGKRNAPAH